MKVKSILAVLAAAPMLFSSAFTVAETVSKDEELLYLYQAAQSDLNLVSSYKKLVAPVLEKADWLENYGTASPAQAENIDNNEYLVFYGCKPHDCPSQSYAVIYDPKQKKMVAGALVTNNYEGQNIKSSETTWLGEADLDLARVLSKYFY